MCQFPEVDEEFGPVDEPLSLPPLSLFPEDRVKGELRIEYGPHMRQKFSVHEFESGGRDPILHHAVPSFTRACKSDDEGQRRFATESGEVVKGKVGIRLAAARCAFEFPQLDEEFGPVNETPSLPPLSFFSDDSVKGKFRIENDPYRRQKFSMQSWPSGGCLPSSSTHTLFQNGTVISDDGVRRSAMVSIPFNRSTMLVFESGEGVKGKVGTGDAPDCGETGTEFPEMDEEFGPVDENPLPSSPFAFLRRQGQSAQIILRNHAG
ncbi:hypothetical protein BDK51DRAFT_25520 [Blyttiomyces helicus]|uniref:Uncharacterized protein n=1 Tax=Blyttiomyces helicus TaxID=388810 RepID=A0A4P9W124_9FUNG|nr:hypothetical protein BDK51DRAFT_25520 [Blyttiomyces helicus]|eukprot:RKO85035.1 hypothetical protein BDK51DRAFT_25520 [Blyttiomyces helicus]